MKKTESSQSHSPLKTSAISDQEKLSGEFESGHASPCFPKRTAKARAAISDVHAEMLDVLVEIDTAVTRNARRGEVLELILDRSLKLIDAPCGTIRLLDTGSSRPRMPYVHGGLHGRPPAAEGRSNELMLYAYRGPVEQEVRQEIRIGEGVVGMAALRYQPIRIDDVTSHPDYLPHLKGMRSELAVPMIWRGKVTGVLNAESPEVGAFDEAAESILTNFARQAAIMVHIARLYRERAKQVQRYSILCEIEEAINVAKSMEEVLDLILRKSVEGTDAASGSLHLLDEDTDELLLAAQKGVPTSVAEKRIKLGSGITGWVARNEQPQCVGDVTKDERYLPYIEGTRSELAAPMFSGGKVIGVFNFESPDVNAFDEDDVELISALANQTATVISMARAKRRQEREAQRLRALIEIADKITEGASLRDVLGLILDYALKLGGYRCGSIRLLDNETQEMVLYSSRGPIEHQPMKRIRIGEGITGWAAKHRRAVYVPDVEKEPRYIRYLEGTRSEFAVPLLRGDELLGVLNVESPQVDAFGDEDREILGALADQASITISIVKSLEELKDAQGELFARERLDILGSIAGKLVHRINNAIGITPNIVRRLIERIEDGDFNREYFLEQLRKLDRGVREAIGMTSQLRKPMQVLLDEDIDIIDLVNAVLSATSPECLTKGIKIVNQLGLGSNRPPLVKGNANRLRDVFEDLIQNAIQAMPAGGTLTIGANLVEEAMGGNASSIEIKISDTGVGVPPEKRDRIFDFGFTTKLSDESVHFGFGLWLAQSVIKLHKGSIRLLEGDLGSGSTFAVTMPLAQADAEAATK